jgi:hypothetical protein
MHTASFYRGTVSLLLTFAVSALAVACGGGEDVGSTSSSLQQGDGTCPASACKDQAVVCQSGAATNVRCVADPNAGAGSDPVGHCLLVADCPADSH